MISVTSLETAAEGSAEKKKPGSPRKRFKVEIDKRLCKGCFICIRYCPMGVFAKSEDIGDLGYDLAKVEHAEKCTGCRMCLLYCPDLAIAIADEGAEKK